MAKAGMKASEKLISAFIVLIVGGVLIVAAYVFFMNLIRAADLPESIIFVLYGLLSFFIYSSRTKIMKFIKKMYK